MQYFYFSTFTAIAGHSDCRHSAFDSDKPQWVIAGWKLLDASTNQQFQTSPGDSQTHSTDFNLEKHSVASYILDPQMILDSRDAKPLTPIL